MQLYHVDLRNRLFLGDRETRFGGVAARHVTAEPGKLNRGLIAVTVKRVLLHSSLSVMAQRKAVLRLNLLPRTERVPFAIAKR
jgi:hypothetical protein